MSSRTAAALAITALSCLALQNQPEKFQALDQAQVITGGKSIGQLELEYAKQCPAVQSFIDDTFEEQLSSMTDDEFQLWSISGAWNAAKGVVKKTASKVKETAGKVVSTAGKV